MATDELDRRDQTPAILARLEQKVDDLREVVRNVEAKQGAFVTLDRLELEIAARNNAFGQMGGKIDSLERDDRERDRKRELIIETRIVPLENSYQQFLGVLKFNRWLMSFVLFVNAILAFFGLHDHIRFG